jgi:hypothetical protein
VFLDTTVAPGEDPADDADADDSEADDLVIRIGGSR